MIPRCDYILHCSHERPVLARHGRCTVESGVLVSARRLRDLKAAPEDVEIEAIGLVDRLVKVLQAMELAALPDGKQVG